MGTSRLTEPWRALVAALIATAFAIGRVDPASAAITASFAGSTLTVTGDVADNVIVISRNAAGQILVNGGAVTVSGGTPTIANTALIVVNGLGGNDTISLDEANGALPAAHLFGGPGNDTLTGGSGADQLFGDADNDTLLGRGGTDQLNGGPGNDILTGGDADDIVNGDGGDDRLVWNPGDDTDVNEGGADIDTVQVNGGGGTEEFTTTANGTRVRFDRINPAPFSLDIGTCEKLVVNANNGDDTFTATGNLAALIQITVDGGPGNDTIFGSNGADILVGGEGNDTVDGQQGDDTILLGAGDDVANWDPGDGNDTIEGQAGADSLMFNGSAGSEIFDLARNGGRFRLSRNLGNIVIDGDDVETIHVRMLSGVDTITIGDLSGTDVTSVLVNLAGPIGADLAIDQVVVNATNGPDAINVAGSISAGARVTGLAATVVVTGSEPSLDVLTINCLDGNDTVSASGLLPGVIPLTLNNCESQPISQIVDLSIAKSASVEPVTAGGSLTYSIVATNTGPGIAETLTISDTLGGALPPAATTQFVTVTASVGATCLAPLPGATGGLVICTWNGTTGPQAHRQVTIVVQVLGLGPLSNTASVGSLTLETNPANNLSTMVSTVVDTNPTPTPTVPPLPTPFHAVYAPVVVQRFTGGW